MKSRSTFLALALISVFAVAGCGQDNNDNGGSTPTPVSTKTATPVVTATATPTAGTPGTPTETPTGLQSPTPTPTAPPSGGCEAQALKLTLTTTAGSDLDTGFSGIGFNQGSLTDTTVTVNLDCPDLQNCTIDGSALIGTPLGAPLPLTAGGVSTCVLNTFREGVTGTYNCSTGCSTSKVLLTSRVFQKQNPVQPCPVCTGDSTPNDGLKQGTCSSDSVTPGAACDVNGISETGLGSTSNDCLPTGSDIGALAVDLDPFTTGTASKTASIDCGDGTPGACFCEGQIAQNQCRGGECVATGVAEEGDCVQGPPVGSCDGVAFNLKCQPGSGTRDCEDLIPGSGTCQTTLQKCIAGNTISRTGVCAPPGSQGAAVAVFCIPKTRTPAINTVVGLPGPGAATLPGMTIRALR